MHTNKRCPYCNSTIFNDTIHGLKFAIGKHKEDDEEVDDDEEEDDDDDDNEKQTTTNSDNIIQTTQKLDNKPYLILL